MTAPPYAAIYDIATDGIDAVLQELRTRAGGEQLIVSEALRRRTCATDPR